jgi:hypothetical protein
VIDVGIAFSISGRPAHGKAQHRFWTDAHRETSMAALVTEPFAFDEDYARALLTPRQDS